MQWVFPIAGKGTRTQSLGEFKPFIKLRRRKIVAWALLSIKHLILPGDQLVFVTTEYFSDKYKAKSTISSILRNLEIENDFEIVLSKDTPPGNAASLYCAKEIVHPNEPLISVNTDQYVDFSFPDRLESKSGFLPIYAQFGDKSSYAKVENGFITKVVEKENISNLASAGIYAVSEAEALFEAIEKMKRDKLMHKDEYYIAPAYNYLIEGGYKIHPVEVYTKYDLGNIESIQEFLDCPLSKL